MDHQERIVVFACNTIRSEVELAYQKTGCTYPIIWLESNLHNFPEKLRAEEQRILDTLDGYDRVLMAIGFCGNSVVGLKTHSFQLTIPRVDDCISLMLGSCANRAALAHERKSIFLTKGWLQNEANIWSEFEYTVRKYGNKKAMRILKEMYKHYAFLSLIDNGAYDVQEIRDTAEKIAEAFHLNLQVIPGTTSLLEQLLTGPWDERNFVTIPPHSVFTYANAALYFS